MNYIFVSYSRKDTHFVSEITSILRLKGIELWQDTFGKEKGLPYSVDWFEYIKSAIYRADAALIFRSESWEVSKPCSKEYSLIKEIHLPFYEIEPFDSTVIPQEIINEILEWHNRIASSDENKLRAWLMSCAYSSTRIKTSDPFIPRLNKLKDQKIFRDRIKESNKYLKRNFSDKNSEALNRARYFIKDAKRKLAFRRCVVLGAIIVFVTTVYMLCFSYHEYYSQLSDFNEIAYNSLMFNRYRIEGENCPITAMIMFSDKQEFVQNSYAWNQMVRYLAYNYPKGCFIDGSKESKYYKNLKVRQTSSRYTINPKENSGQIFVEDKNNGTIRQLVIDHSNPIWSIDDNDNTLVVACGKRIYVYDLNAISKPILLYMNYETVAKVGFNGNNVYAVSKSGNVLLWDNPVKCRNKNEVIVSNAMSCIDGEEIRFVYPENNAIAINTDNEIQHVNIDGFKNICGMNISRSGKWLSLSAVSTRDNNTHILVIDLEKGSVIADKPIDNIGNIITAVCDDYVAYTVDNNLSIEMWWWQSDITKKSEALNKQCVYLTIGRKELAVHVKNGIIGWFNENLEPITGWRQNSVQWGNPIQTAYCEKRGLLYTATQGSEVINGFTTSGLNDRIYYRGEEIDGIISCSSLAVNQGGDYIAYGYPDGRIVVRSAYNMDVWADFRIITEPIIALGFIDFNSIYALGKSGTVYCIDTEGYFVPLSTSDPTNTEKLYWMCIEEILTNLQNIGIIDLS